jgi:ribosomal protein L20
MARVKRGVTTRAKHKRILDNAKGYYGRLANTPIAIARLRSAASAPCGSSASTPRFAPRD